MTCVILPAPLVLSSCRLELSRMYGMVAVEFDAHAAVTSTDTKSGQAFHHVRALGVAACDPAKAYG